MMCFRNTKERYRQVDSKSALMALHDHFERLVQETHWCSDFTERPPNTGYRG